MGPKAPHIFRTCLHNLGPQTPHPDTVVVQVLYLSSFLHCPWGWTATTVSEAGWQTCVLHFAGARAKQKVKGKCQPYSCPPPGAVQSKSNIKIVQIWCPEGVRGPRLHDENAKNVGAEGPTHFSHFCFAVSAPRPPPDTIVAQVYIFRVVSSVPGDGLPQA